MDRLTEIAWTLDPSLILVDAGFRPDNWQARLLRSTSTNVLLNIHRQGGKSQTTAALALGQAVLEDDSLVLLVSRTQRQSDELYRKVYQLFERLGRPIPATEDQARTLSLENGSRIVSLPGSPDNLRAFSAPKLIVVDEASRVDDEMEGALTPMLATVPDGRLIYLSTPYGKRGFFWRAWEDKTVGWKKFEVKALHCPRISAEFLRNERSRLGSRMYSQEYECSFEETEDQYFATDAVNSAFSTNLMPLFPGGMP